MIGQIFILLQSKKTKHMMTATWQFISPGRMFSLGQWKENRRIFPDPLLSDTDVLTNKSQGSWLQNYYTSLQKKDIFHSF